MNIDERLSIAWDFYKNDMFLRKYAMERRECDPFAPVINLEDGVWALPHYAPDHGGASNAYLVCGTQRALLIDTAYGIGDLKALCAELTPLPVDVVNTHYHGDHTGGNSRFGACFMHALDAAKPEMLKVPQPIALLEKNPVNFYAADDVAAPGRGHVECLQHGYVFELGGGYDVEVVHLAGHTSGSIGLIDRRRGILFSGDAIMSQPCSTLIVNFAGTAGDPNATVEAFRDCLRPLAGRMSEIRYLCPGHCALQAPPQLIADALACCDEILSDPSIGGEARFRAGARMHVHGLMSITYTESHIYRHGT